MKVDLKEGWRDDGSGSWQDPEFSFSGKEHVASPSAVVETSLARKWPLDGIDLDLLQSS